MDNFLETYHPLKVNQEEIDHFIRLVTSNEIKYHKKKKSLNKSLGPDVFTSEFYQTYKEQTFINPS